MSRKCTLNPESNSHRSLKVSSPTEKDNAMRYYPRRAAMSVLALMAVLAGCVSTQTGSISTEIGDDLSCTLPTNCVTTVGTHGMSPLRFTGSVDDGLAQLHATLSTFSEAKITRVRDEFIEAIFSTPAGFRDTVIFRLNASEKKIDFRSRSGFGLFDFGKNSARMTAFAARFAQQPNVVRRAN